MKTLPQTINELSRNLDELSARSNMANLNNWSGAVNLLLLDEHVVFIKRSENMPSHKGEIAFMGGYRKVEDNHDPFVSAAREFREESALDSKIVDYLGLLSPVTTSRNKMIIPALGRISLNREEFLDQVKSNGEWTELITVPISYLMLRSNWVQGSWNSYHQRGAILFCPIPRNSYFSYQSKDDVDHMLWGATARIVWDSLNIIEKLIKD